MQPATSPECIPALEFPEIPNKDELVDWTYSKRREMQEIVPGVYLGPYSAATNSELHVLKQVGISHVICIRHEREAHYIRANFPEHFIYLVLNVADSTTENIIRHFPKVKAFVDSCLNSGGKVLLHGTAGISRSAALMIAFIMETYGLTYREAFHYVQQRRFCINPNEGFVQQLIEYEPIYLANYQARTAGERLNQGGVKRSFEDESRDDAMDT